MSCVTMWGKWCVELPDSVLDPDPHKEMPPGSGSAWTDADPNPGGKKAWEMYGTCSLGEYRT